MGSDVKQIVIKNLKDATKWNEGEENQSFQDWTDTTNVDKNLDRQLNQRIRHFENITLWKKSIKLAFPESRNYWL